MMEFHISREARERYQFSGSLFSYNGNVVFADMPACRAFAYLMNQVREADKNPDQAIHAGALFAMGLIDEASHVVIARYREQFDRNVMADALAWFGSQMTPEALDKLLLTFVEYFPGSTVIRGEETPQQWLQGSTDGTPHREAALEELLLLWTANRNEAFQPFEELFAEKPLAEQTVYRQVTQQLPEYFATRPLIPMPGAKSMNLVELLRAPANASPKSLREQLDLVRQLWKPLLGDALDRFLQIAGEILHEEELAIWMQYNTPAARARAASEEAARRRREAGMQQWPSIASTADVPVFGDPAHEYEKFSPDTAWMPTTVMIAKSTYVWLAQLSRFYGRHIRRLDEIPRRRAADTRRSRHEHAVAHRHLGAQPRFENHQAAVREPGRCRFRLFAVRLSHRGRPGRRIGLHQPSRPRLSPRHPAGQRHGSQPHGHRLALGGRAPRVVHLPLGVALSGLPLRRPRSLRRRPRGDQNRGSLFHPEDAAVVFRRRDKSSGETRYIYHGNDGTSFPWNDTAQLDYLNPAVREQVIQTILHVARLFPVIRFDAAMTLAKRHFHRLWFPGPGFERRHPLARRIQHEPGRIRPGHAPRILARGRRSRRR